MYYIASIHEAGLTTNRWASSSN